MAPKVCIPADFGRHHIGAPSHGNLAFNLKEGPQIKANSIIMSLNSPVIDDLTTKLHLTSLEADDFTREAVDCFIEASYTGEVEMLNKGNFRDVNKMSHVFKVCWITAKCKQFFVSYVDTLNSDSEYSEMLFAVEEAVYHMSALKKEDFLNVVASKMNTVSVQCRDDFIYQYLSDLTNSSRIQIEACRTIVKLDVHVMVEVLIKHVEKQGNKSLDDKTRYILKSVDLAVCHQRAPEIFSKLHTVLENLESADLADFLAVVAVNKQLLTSSQNPFNQQIESTLNHDSDHQDKSMISFDLLPYSKDFKRDVSFDTVLQNIKVDPGVNDFYTFVDGMWCRYFQGNLSQLNKSYLLSQMAIVKLEKGWKELLSRNYIDKLVNDSGTTHLIDPIKQCQSLVSLDTSIQLVKVDFFDYLSVVDFVKTIFKQDNVFNFEIADDWKYRGIKFVLKTTAMKGKNLDTFSIKYGFENPGQSQLVDLPKLHFGIEQRGGIVSEFLPISWCGKPTCDEAKTNWNWGYINFHNKNHSVVDYLETDCGVPPDLEYFHSLSGDCMCRLVAWVIS